MKLHYGRGIAAICPHRYVGKNNCAHYVGHVLGLQLGILCNLSGKKEAGRASIRVNEIYNNLESTGVWADRPHLNGSEQLLVFVTSARHVDPRTDTMNDHPQKHIGIYVGGKVYNYSNSHHRVVADPVDAFLEKFDSIYEGDDIALYFGVVS